MQKDNIRALIVGAGFAGSLAYQALQEHKDERVPVGFVDDDDQKNGSDIDGLPVLGNRFAIPAIVKKHKVNEIIIAMPSTPSAEVSKIAEICKKTNARVKILPGTYDLITGNIQLAPIRDVRLDDLLGREPLLLDTEEIVKYLHNEVVLITGAGGSVGTELAVHAGNNNPRQLILMGRGENSIFEVEQKLRYSHPHVNIVSEIGDIRDQGRMRRLFCKYEPGVVFHAAAHKHVPYMERNPEEAVKNNIIGTKIVCETAMNTGCKKFILVSTDKAVKPTSVMGASKKVAEMIVLLMNDLGPTKFAAVRFGNILGSRGSVLPLFERQIAQGGPVTITHPEMTRYFMTVNEAAQLVIQAGAMAVGGEVFILDMGEPICIKELALKLIKMKGLRPFKDIAIKYIGVRPGEKISEILTSEQEIVEITKHKRILSVLNKKVDHRQVKDMLYQFQHPQFTYRDEEIEALLKTLTD